MPHCQYKSDKVDEWFKVYQQQLEEELQKDEEKDQLFLEKEEYDAKIMERVKPLAMRLYDPNNAESNNQLKQMLSKKRKPQEETKQEV